MSTVLAPVTGGLDLFDPAAFEHAQRVGKMFAASQLIPEHMRGKLPDVVIALTMARRFGEDPLIVMQSMYVVHGRPGWSAQYVIGRANRSGVFRGRINWRETGEGDSLVVEAFAVLAETGEEISFAASMKMAKDEGWTKNPKYRSMPKLMLRYRSAVLLVRLYAPEVMLGIPSAEEVEDEVAAERIELVPESTVGTPVARPQLTQAPTIDQAGSRMAQLDAVLEPEPAQDPEPAKASPQPAQTRSEGGVTKAPREVCPVCTRDFARLKSGALRQHTVDGSSDGPQCPGSGGVVASLQVALMEESIPAGDVKLEACEQAEQAVSAHLGVASVAVARTAAGVVTPSSASPERLDHYHRVLGLIVSQSMEET